MGVMTVRKGGGTSRPRRDITEVISDLLELTKDAEQLQMHRVVLCLQYAYWEALSEISPKTAVN